MFANKSLKLTSQFLKNSLSRNFTSSQVVQNSVTVDLGKEVFATHCKSFLVNTIG